LPPSSAKGLAGKRVDAYLAGIIPINFMVIVFGLLFAKVRIKSDKQKIHIEISPLTEIRFVDYD
jgi:hypothetical protein